jgi:hypothetical protein
VNAPELKASGSSLSGQNPAGEISRWWQIGPGASPIGSDWGAACFHKKKLLEVQHDWCSPRDPRKVLMPVIVRACPKLHISDPYAT